MEHDEMEAALLFLGFVLMWFVLQRFVLPRFGVHT
jgi:hypothetical protein